MEPSLGAQIFWMITIGLVLGFLSYYAHKRRDLAVKLVPSIFIGVFGSLVGGVLAYVFGLLLPVAYAFMGAVGFLFLVNSFRQKKDWEDETDETSG